MSFSSQTVVLLVDQFVDEREMYAEFLRLNAFEVIESAQAADAQQKAIGTGPAIVITDTVLGAGIDGIELTRLLKTDPRTAGLPVIVLSGRVRPVDRAGAERAGCDVFLPKPCLPDALLLEIRKVLFASQSPAQV